MIITTLGIVGLVSCFGCLYLGKKAWIGFHKSVGVSHKKMNYVDDCTDENMLPNLTHLNLVDSYVLPLPISIKQQLERINQRVATYEAWQEVDNGRSVTLCEDAFVLKKLINTHLPEMIEDYLYIQKSSYNQQQKYHPQMQDKAFVVLQQCLTDVEYRFGRVIDNYESQKLENLETMKRYLNSRD